MAETLATLALISALAMFISPIFEKGKWLASLTAGLSAMALFLSPLEGIHQSRGSGLIIVTVLCIVIQYHIHKGMNKKYFNGFGGGITFVLLLAMYPEEGIKETVNEYTTMDGILVSLESILIGVILSQLLYNSISFDYRNSAAILVILVALSIFTDFLQSGELLVVVASMCFLGYLPFLEDLINPKIGNGAGRSNALAISTAIGIILIFVITYASVSTVNRIGEGDGAIAVALWLTVAVTGVGLLGMLLPLLGFDSHPRPEAWGWRFGISISAMLVSLQTDLAPHLLIGIAAALLISISSPLVLEKTLKKLP